MTDTRDNRVRVDWQRLAADLDATCRRRHISLRTAAREIDVPSSGLTEMRAGRARLSADAVARLTAWLYPRNVPWWVTGGSHNHEEED